MWVKKDMETWDTNTIKRWLSELDDTYFELNSSGKSEADDMFQWGIQILKERNELTKDA